MLSSEFKAAHHFSQANGIRYLGLVSDEKQRLNYLTPQFCEHLRRIVSVLIGGDSRGTNSKCFEVSNAIFNHLIDLDVPCYLTMGWVSYAGIDYFRHSGGELSEWISKGVPDRHSVRMHCWLTFPSGEILDATLASYISVKTGRHELLGNLIAQASECSGDFTYNPTLIGADALRRLGLEAP